MTKKILLFLFAFAGFIAAAQEPAQPQMADSFRADGKIYVVISVMAIVFAALVFYLVMIDRKLKKLEDQMNNKNG